MRPAIKDFVTIFSHAFPISEPIYEFGSLRVSGQEDYADLRPLFPGKKYIGADMREGLGVDVVLNLHDVDLLTETVKTVLCVDTLEHVEYPHKAMSEIYRILDPNGIVVISSVMCYKIHDHPYDYWRFTPEAFRSLLKPFASSFVGFAGDEIFPHTVVGIGFKGNKPSWTEFEKKYYVWQQKHFRRGRISMAKKIRKLITPPLFSKTSRKALGL